MLCFLTKPMLNLIQQNQLIWCCCVLPDSLHWGNSPRSLRAMTALLSVPSLSRCTLLVSPDTFSLELNTPVVQISWYFVHCAVPLGYRVNMKFCLCLIKHHTMMKYESGGVAPCLTLVLDGRQQPAPYTIASFQGRQNLSTQWTGVRVDLTAGLEMTVKRKIHASTRKWIPFFKLISL
jgi:hypothetical protein